MGLLKVSSVFDKSLMPEKDDYCVYSLLNEQKKVVYVGQSGNLRQRIFSHLSSDKEFDYVQWCVCEKNEMNNLEAEGIVKSNNSMNKTLPKNDLYIGLGCVRKEIAEKAKEITGNIDVVFSSSNSVKYITREDYDKAMSIFDSFFKDLADGFVKPGEEK